MCFFFGCMSTDVTHPEVESIAYNYLCIPINIHVGFLRHRTIPRAALLRWACSCCQLYSHCSRVGVEEEFEGSRVFSQNLHCHSLVCSWSSGAPQSGPLMGFFCHGLVRSWGPGMSLSLSQSGPFSGFWSFTVWFTLGVFHCQILSSELL